MEIYYTLVYVSLLNEVPQCTLRAPPLCFGPVQDLIPSYFIDTNQNTHEGEVEQTSGRSACDGWGETTRCDPTHLVLLGGPGALS